MGREREIPKRDEFRVGDRVIYRVSRRGVGNGELDGRHGVVVYIDDTRAPITVQLDEPYLDALTEVRTVATYGRKIPNCWFCRPENLLKISQKTERSIL